MKAIMVFMGVFFIMSFIMAILIARVLADSIVLQGEIRETQWEQDSIINSDIHIKLRQLRLRDYQLEVVEDSVLMYDDNRLVGTFKLQYDADPVGTLIEEDNQ